MIASIPVRSIAICAAFLLAATVCASPVAAQLQDRRLGAGMSVERYAFSAPEVAGIADLLLVTAPFGAAAQLGSRVRLEARGAFASGTMTAADGATSSLSGLTDTEARVGIALLPDALGLEVIAYLPTGISSLDDGEAAVAGAAAADLLPLAISQWGAGGAVAVALTGARRFGSTGVGVSASFRGSAEFAPVAGDDFTYRPGNEAHVRLAVDRPIGPSGRLSAAAGIRRFGADAGNDRNLFQTGDRVEFSGSYSFAAGLRGAGALYGGMIGREAGTFLDRQAAATPPQILFLAGGVVRLPVGRVQVMPRLDARFFSSEGGAGAGFVVGAGTAAEFRLRRSVLIPRVGVRLGRIQEGTGATSSLTGFLAGVTIRFGSGAGRSI